MGDHSITIVPRKSTFPGNEVAAKKILTWLVSNDIVKGEASDCVLGASYGYAMSDGAKKITSLPEYLPFPLITDGLEIVTERSVFDTGENGLEEMICPACKQNIANEEWTFFGSWFEDNTDNIVCPLCEKESSIHHFIFTPQWGFSNLGFRFWNWPDFTDEFILQFTKLLACDVDIVYTKI